MGGATIPQTQCAPKFTFKNDIKATWWGNHRCTLNRSISSHQSAMRNQQSAISKLAIEKKWPHLQLVSAIRINSLQSPFIISAIVYPWQDHKFNISYQETAIGNEYHQLETISNKVAGEAATTNAATMAGESHSLTFAQNRKFILEHMSSSLSLYLNGFKSFNQLESVNIIMNNLQIYFPY